MGAEAVIEKILARASAEADKIKSAGKADADKRSAEAEAAAEAEKEAILTRGRAEADAIRYREKLKAELDVRKNTLAEKRALLDRVYSGVREKLASLPDGEKAELYAKLAASFGMTENVKVYASADMKAFAEANAARWGGAYAGEIKGSIFFRQEDYERVMAEWASATSSFTCSGLIISADPSSRRISARNSIFPFGPVIGE